MGRGRNLDGVAIIIGAAAGHAAPSWVVAFDCDGELADAKRSDESAVLRDHNIARIVGDAVVPHQELVADIGDGLNGGGVAIVIFTAADDGAPIGVVGFEGESECRLRWGRLYDEVGDDDELFGLIQDFSVFINRLCISIIHSAPVDDQVADSRKFGQGV